LTIIEQCREDTRVGSTPSRCSGFIREIECHTPSKGTSAEDHSRVIQIGKRSKIPHTSISWPCLSMNVNWSRLQFRVSAFSW